MPSPGKTSIINSLCSYSFIPEGTSTAIYFNSSSTFIQKLGNALHNGWTSSSPITSTTMVTTFNTEFTSFFDITYGTLGKQVILALATGIDTEIGVWVASWASPPNTHAHIVTANTIHTQIIAAMPIISSVAVTTLLNAVSNTFANGFQQEVG